MKKTAVTVAAAVLVLAAVTLCICFSVHTFTGNQISTLKLLAIICSLSVLYCFAVGEITQNFSQMDKLWSVLPVAYVWVVAARGGMKVRLIIYALIVTAWGIRLTVNFARKGAYRLKFWLGEEDYRWSIVRKTPVFKHRAAWTLFNLLFISAYQNILVLGICLPSVACMESSVPVGAADAAAAALSLAFLTLETVSDENQWKFHSTKKKLIAEYGGIGNIPEPYRLGFNTTGPWGYMRHPNYLGEQGFWLCMYGFSIAAGNGVLHWTATGPLLLILLFMGSSALGESISSGKYPEYKNYAKQVYKYIPAHKYNPGS